MKITDFKEGDPVYYIPSHARNDIYHPHIETGRVKRVGANQVFVYYFFVIYGEIHWQSFAKATNPEDLRLV